MLRFVIFNIDLQKDIATGTIFETELEAKVEFMNSKYFDLRFANCMMLFIENMNTGARSWLRSKSFSYDKEKREWKIVG